MTGEGVRRIGLEILHPFAQEVRVNPEVPRRLRGRHPALPDQPDSLPLELLAVRPSSSHDSLQFE